MRRSPKPSCRRMRFRKRRSRPTRALRLRGLDSPNRQLLLSLRLESFAFPPRRPCFLSVRPSVMCLDLDLVAGHRIGVRPVVLAVIYLVLQVPFSVQPPFTFLCLKTWLVCVSGSVLFAAIRLNFPGKERERLERSVSLSLSLSLYTRSRTDALCVLRERTWLWREFLSPCSAVLLVHPLVAAPLRESADKHQLILTPRAARDARVGRHARTARSWP